MDQQENTPKPQKPSTQKTKHMVLRAVFLMFIVMALGFSGGWIGARSYSKNPDAFSQQTDDAKRTVSSQSELISSIADEVGPSVVSVNVTSQQSSSSALFGGGQVVEQESAGTGFVISEDGYIVTNRHVIPEGATEVNVVLSEGKVFENVEVVGKTSSQDPLDIAFLKINNTGGYKLKPVVIGNSSKMRVGDMTIAIGNALGQFQNTVTSGIISGFGRSVQAQNGAGSVESLNNLFQTDAAINQGNSGGPLVNADGQVIGVNTAVAGDGAENIGFAIPIDDVGGLIKSVLKDGELQRPYIGVRYVQLNQEIAKEVGVDQTEGAYIPQDSRSGASIISDSPAEKAGLKQGDIIQKVNDQTVDQTNTLSSIIGRHSVGEEVTLTIIRDNKNESIKLKLEALPQN